MWRSFSPAGWIRGVRFFPTFRSWCVWRCSMAREVEYVITHGPTKEAMRDSLTEGSNIEGTRLPVDFELELRGDPHKYKFLLHVYIDDMGREDGSGEGYNFIASPAQDS